jgi:hypothetical protein
MPQLDPRIPAEVDDLVASGKRIADFVTGSDKALHGDQLAEASMWVTRLGQLIRNLYGEQSQHFDSYKAALAENAFFYLHSNNHRQFTQMVGIARAVQHDIKNGLLVDLRTLAQAEVFADFLEMGEYLLSGNYKDAAAVIIGAVLEDGLRKLTTKYGLPLTGPDGKSLTIDPLNSQLVKANAYSKLTQKQITTWAHLRNKAAHGQFADYNAEQVQMMLTFVQAFAAEYMQ